VNKTTPQEGKKGIIVYKTRREKLTGEGQRRAILG